MDDDLWKKFWDLNEKDHELDKRITMLETQGTTEEKVEDDNSADDRWRITLIISIIAAFLSSISTLIVVLNFLHS